MQQQQKQQHQRRQRRGSQHNDDDDGRQRRRRRRRRTTIASTPIPAFAEGGIVSGPTVGLMGEYPGAGAGNPEVIAPLKKLQGMMGSASQQVEVTGKISGNDILLISQKAQFNRNRFV